MSSSSAQQTPSEFQQALHFPYFRDPRDPKYSDRMFQGIPSIAVTSGNRLWATWYGGGMQEGHENYILLSSSGDGGVTWDGIHKIIDPPFRASEPAVWVDPAGCLWFLANLYPGKNHLRAPGSQLWAITARNPDSANPAWSSPRLIAMEQNCFNKPIVLSDGTWLWPSGTWNLENLSQPMLSSDNGKSFFSGGPISLPLADRDFEEYNVVERNSGDLWLLTRTNYGIGESISRDRGMSWSEVVPSKIAHSKTRFFLTRLRSGNFLLIKHGMIDEDPGRSKLMAFLSVDEGLTWKGGLMLDDRERVSYPDGCQGEDGTIFIIYDRERTDEKEILMAAFSEEDAASGSNSSGKVRLRELVNRATLFNPEYSQKPDPG